MYIKKKKVIKDLKKNNFAKCFENEKKSLK